MNNGASSSRTNEDITVFLQNPSLAPQYYGLDSWQENQESVLPYDFCSLVSSLIHNNYNGCFDSILQIFAPNQSNSFDSNQNMLTALPTSHFFAPDSSTPDYMDYKLAQNNENDPFFYVHELVPSISPSYSSTTTATSFSELEDGVFVYDDTQHTSEPQQNHFFQVQQQQLEVNRFSSHFLQNCVEQKDINLDLKVPSADKSATRPTSHHITSMNPEMQSPQYNNNINNNICLNELAQNLPQVESVTTRDAMQTPCCCLQTGAPRNLRHRNSGNITASNNISPLPQENRTVVASFPSNTPLLQSASSKSSSSYTNTSCTKNSVCHNKKPALPTTSLSTGSSSSKKNVCQICEKLFKRPQELFRHHLSIHSGQKRVSCPVCGKVYSRRDALIRHLKKVEEKGEDSKNKHGANFNKNENRFIHGCSM